MNFVANTLVLNSFLKEHPMHNSELFGRNSTWFFGYTLWLGTPNDRLIVSHFTDGKMKIIGRGKFENVDNAELLVFNDNALDAMFVVLFYDKNGSPILPGGFIGVDVNRPGTNNATESFELRFIGANFEKKLFAFGFCVSDPGEPDTGAFIVSNKRKQALLCYNIARAAQRFHGNHERLKELLPVMLGNKDKE